ncbi:rhomboid family intramembrane serine protease [Chitinispirillales bacterium ANBcel5]|uniref:rhomboid family intramembrane serine protease n=1 Tax=Cellulosispirillum alkaliphilum TaxID=3039283 RepID=UPI002A597CB0|nr:rhomboid family intramembrane serine protease [Chitinispirillales bacterium ANBcel5]
MIPVKNTLSIKFPFATTALIIFCIIVFFAIGDRTIDYALVPLDFFHALFHPSKEKTPQTALTLLTAFFMHANLFHLLSNVWFLKIFGGAVESKIRILPFLFAYFLCGLLSVFIQALSSPFSTVPVVGASGAIAGVMGMHLIFFPFSRLIVFFPPIFLFKIPAFLYLIPWFWIQYINIGKSSPDIGGIAWYAHASGFIAGILFSVYYTTKKEKR